MTGFCIHKAKGRALLHFSRDRSAISLEENLPKERRESPCQLSSSRE